MKHLFLFTIFFNILSEQFAQNLTFEQDQLAHRRYWFYRTRMINDFTKIGSAQGNCIVFAERNYDFNYPQYSLNYSKVGPDQIDIMNQYLSALALEHKLLARNNQYTGETLKEIFYILETYNRLDEEADQFWNQNSFPSDLISKYTQDRNGFMLREDMPKDFFKKSFSNDNFFHLNYGYREYNYDTTQKTKISYSGLHETFTLTLDNKFSNYVGFPSNNNTQNIFDLPLVMDKYYSMFNAFLFLIKYLPNNTYHYENGQPMAFSDGEIDIKTEVRKIATRCYDYFTGGQFGNNNLDWVLEYPNGNILSAGKDMWAYSYPMAKMYCYIMNGYPYQLPCNSYQTLKSSTTGFVTYNTFYLNPIPSISPIPGIEDASVFLGNVQAGSNAPVYLPSPIPGVYLPVPLPISTAMVPHTNLNNIQWAQLMRKVLHQNQPLIASESLFSGPISNAPCIGPYQFGSNNLAVAGWRSPDLLEHPSARNSWGTNPGNYPGVDYMLLHNLYYEYLNQKDDGPGQIEQGAYKNAYNLMDNYDEQTWPVYHVANGSGFNPVAAYLIGINEESVTQVNLPGPGGPVPFIKAPARVKLFQNLESRAQIYASASPAAPNNTISSKVEYRAGKEITLLPENGSQPGFEVKLGSDFHAYIKRYICANPDNGPLEKQSPNEPSTDFETDLMNTEIPIHHVDHPKSDSDLYPGEMTTDQYAGQEINEIQNILLTEYQNESPEKINTIQKELLTQRLVALPNPNNGVFRIYATRISDEETFNYSILDMKGQVILNEENIKSGINKEIDLSQYAEGIYMIQLNSNIGYKLNKKVTVIK